MKKALKNIGHILSILIMIAGAVFTIAVLVKPQLLIHMIHYVGDAILFLGWKNYLLISLIGLIESIPFLNMAIPGQTFMIIISGFLAQFDYFGTSMTVVIISALGDHLAFYLGKHNGSRLLTAYGPTFGLTDKSLDKIRGMLKKMGHRAVFVSKRNSYTRGMLPFLAGMNHMKKWEFALYNMLGSVVYGFILVRLAKLFVGNTERVVPYIRRIGIGLMVIVLIWYFLIRKRDEHKAG